MTNWVYWQWQGKLHLNWAFTYKKQSGISSCHKTLEALHSLAILLIFQLRQKWTLPKVNFMNLALNTRHIIGTQRSMQQVTLTKWILKTHLPYQEHKVLGPLAHYIQRHQQEAPTTFWESRPCHHFPYAYIQTKASTGSSGSEEGHMLNRPNNGCFAGHSRWRKLALVEQVQVLTSSCL